MMKNRLLAVCGFGTGLLFFPVFTLFLLKSVGAFSIKVTHGTPVQRVFMGLYNFHWDSTFVLSWLLVSGLMFCLIVLIFLNIKQENSARPLKGFGNYLNLINIGTLFLATMFITTVFAFIGIDYHHDGIMLKPAMDVANGKILFKETFTQYGALTVLMQAAALAVFSKSLIVLRLLTSLFYGCISILLYLLFIQFLKKWQAVLAVALWLLMAPFYLTSGGASVLLPWSSVYSLFCQLTCILLCVRYFKTRNFYLLVLCGVFAALTFLFRQPVGITIMGALLIIVSILCFLNQGIRAVLRAVAGLIAGFALVMACFTVYQLSAGSLKDWYLQSMVYAGNWCEIVTGKQLLLSIYYSLLLIYSPFTNAWLWKIMPLVCVVLSIVVSYALLVKKKVTDENISLFIMAVGCLSSWPQYFPVSCNTHLFWAASPMFGVTVYFFWRLAGCFKMNKIKIALFTSAILLTFGFQIKTRIRVGFNKVVSTFENNVPAESPLIKGMLIPESEAAGFAQLYETVNGYLKNYPDKTVVNLGRDALFSALSGNRRNAHCIYVNWGKYCTGIYPDYYEKLADFIKKERPLCLVPEDAYDGKDILDPLLKQCNYRMIRKTPFGFQVMIPSS